METVLLEKIEDHSLVPQFDLRATGGRRAQLWGYKGRENLVIFFLSNVASIDGRRLLTELRRRYAQYREHNAETLVISNDNIETLERLAAELDLPFPLASDADGRATERYTDRVPSVFVIDRYGELYAQSSANSETDLPNGDQLLDWLRLIELQCPECGVPTWRP